MLVGGRGRSRAHGRGFTDDFCHDSKGNKSLGILGEMALGLDGVLNIGHGYHAGLGRWCSTILGS